MAASSIHVMRFSLPVLQLTACSTSAYLLPVFLVSSSQDGAPRIPSVSLNDSGSSSEGTQTPRPEDGGQKPFMMMAPMFLPHCPGDEDQPLPDIPAPCPYLTSQHPDRQLNGPPPIAPDGSKRSGSGQARRCTHHCPTDGSPVRGETLQCVRNCWHDKNCHLPEDMITRMPHVPSARCICSLFRCSCRSGGRGTTSPTCSK